MVHDLWGVGEAVSGSLEWQKKRKTANTRAKPSEYVMTTIRTAK